LSCSLLIEASTMPGGCAAGRTARRHQRRCVGGQRGPVPRSKSRCPFNASRGYL